MKIAFDTNIIISRRIRIFPRNHSLSAIVLTELVSGAQDRSDIKLWEAIQQFAQRSQTFIVPDAEDWLQAGLALQRLSQQSKRENFGSPPNSPPKNANAFSTTAFSQFPAAARESRSSPTTSKILSASLPFAESNGNAVTITSPPLLFEHFSTPFSSPI